MKTGFLIQVSNDKHDNPLYFRGASLSHTKNIEKARIYTEMATILRYAISFFVKDDRIICGPHLIQVKLDDKTGRITDALDVGELWQAIHMYNMGFQAATYLKSTRSNF